MTLYYTLDQINDTRKKEFVAIRLERDLFIMLKQKAETEGSDLSNTIRTLCRIGLENGNNQEIKPF